MQYTTTISQKGQIVVPKDIRDKLNLKPSDSLNISLVGDKILVKPNSSVEEFLGIFNVKKPITKKDIKESFKKHIENKYK